MKFLCRLFTPKKWLFSQKNQGMTVLDIILIIPLVYAVYAGFKKGILAQLGGIVGIVIGIWLACRFSERVGQWFGIDEKIAYYVAFILIVIACLIGIGILGWALGKIFNFVGLGLLNRLGGVVLSLVKTVLILGALFMAFHAINEHTRMVDRKQFDNSLLYGPIERMTDFSLPFLKKAVDSFDFSDDK